jgi:hypothetical protein
MRRPLISLGLAALVLLIWPASALAATTDPLLGTAGNYAVLAGTTITNTGPSWITGQMGVSPGAAVTGFPGAGGATSGHIDAANPASCQALADLGPANGGACTNAGGGAETRASGETPCTSEPVNLGGLTLGPGLYCGGTLGITGGETLTLTGGGIYIFQSAATLITGNSSRVLLTGGAQPCDIFWTVASSATIAPATTFVGNIMAVTSIAMQTGATLNGRAMARNGAVTLDTNRIIQPSGCAGNFTTSYPVPTYVPPPPGTILPATLGVPWELVNEIPWLLVIAVGAGIGAGAMVVNNRRRRRRSA